MHGQPVVDMSQGAGQSRCGQRTGERHAHNLHPQRGLYHRLGHDEQTHAYLNGGDVAFAGDSVTYVGRRYDGTADTTIDGTDLMVMPGLIDLHSHPSTEPFYRGVREEHGVPAMYMSGLYERSVALQPDPIARRAGKQVAFCEMLLSGITSVADLSGIDEGWIDTALHRVGCAYSWPPATPRHAGISRTAGRSNTAGTRPPEDAGSMQPWR